MAGEMKYHFEKAYTRDVSLILQETWYYGQQHGLDVFLEKKNPCAPFNVYYMNEGAIEVWENVEALQWLKDSLLEKNTSDPDFLDRSIAWYKNLIKPLEFGWKEKELSSLQELQAFIAAAFLADAAFLVFYYSAVDERTPRKLREKALKVRDRDTFFEDSDKTIRNTLVSLYPQVSGCETTILSKEITAVPAILELQARLQASVLIPESYYEKIRLEKFEQQHPQYLFRHENIPTSFVEEISGNVAYKGKAKGRVRILRRKSEIQTLQEWEILLSPMTTPDYIPAMQKASAFVTDEGGITCHAAIVAREMKKPCVIGTKIATKVFKDGDMLEVDADKGVVRRIPQ